MEKLQMQDRIKPYKLMKQEQEMLLSIIDKAAGTQMVPHYYHTKSMLSHLNDCLDKAAQGLPIVATNFGFPIELLYYFDCIPVVMESLSYTLGTSTGEYYDAMDNWGHPFHTCTSQKGAMGMILNGLFKFDLIAISSVPCDNAIASYPTFKHLQEKPPKIVIADMPYYRDERSQAFYTEELLRVRDKIGEVLEQEPNEENFKRAIEIENKNLLLVKEIQELKKAEPCPIDSIFVPTNVISNMNFRGSELRTVFLEEMLKYAKENYEKGIKPVGKEKFRTIWPNMTIYFDPLYCDYLDKRGITVLFDVFSFMTSDPINLNRPENDIIKQLAWQNMNFPMTRQVQGNADQFIQDNLFLAKEYNADAAIFTNHYACKSLQPMVQLLREALRDELDIPLLSIEVDVGDPRHTSLKTIRRAVNEFFKTMFPS